MQKIKRLRLKKWLPLAAATGILFLSAWVSKAAPALWNEELAVHVDGRQVENSTLVVGTHLIHLSALTDPLYEIALKSAEASMQNKVFYKSELAGGTWFDITSASSMADISTGGKPVTVEEINLLFFEYHTKSDGVTYDLRTGQPVNIFDIRSPYDLEAMEELRPMQLQYSMLEEKGDLSETEEWCRKKLKEFFSYDVLKGKVETSDPNTGEVLVYSGVDAKEWDEFLKSLQGYLSVLEEYGGGSGEKEKVAAVMESVDASRRQITYEIIYDQAYKLMEILTQSDADRQLPEGYQIDGSLTDAVNESIANLTDALIDISGKVLTKGGTILSSEVYFWSERLIHDSRNGSHASCDEDVKNLIALQNIMDGTIKDQQTELKLLEENLIPAAAKAYASGLGNGENSDYLTAKADGAASVLLSSIAEQYINLVNTSRNELEFLIDAKCARLPNQASQDYIRSLIAEAPGSFGGIPYGGFYDRSKNSLDEYTVWLNGKLDNLVTGGGGGEANSLKEEKEELQQQYMEALDQNDIESAGEIQAKIEGVEGKIKALAASQQKALNKLDREIQGIREELKKASVTDAAKLNLQLGKLQAESAVLRTAMTGESIGAQALELKAEGVKLITDEPSAQNTEQLYDIIEALGGMMELDYTAVFPALSEIYSEMARKKESSGTEAYDQGIVKAEDLILNSRTAYEAALEPVASAKELEGAAGIFFGEEDKSKWTEEQEAVFLIAGQMYLEDVAGKQPGGTVPGTAEMQSGAETQPGAGGQSGTGGQSGNGTQPGTGNQPGTGGQSGAETQPGTGGQSGGETQPGTGGQSETETQPGTGGQLGGETQPGTGGQSGAETQPGTEGQSETETQPGTEGQSGAETQPGNGTQPGTGNQPGTGGQSGAETQSGTEGQSGAETQSGTEGQSGAETQPGTGGQPGTGTEPGMGGQSEAETEPGTGGQSGAETQPGTGNQPGTGGQSGAEIQPGSETQPESGSGSQMGSETDNSKETGIDKEDGTLGAGEQKAEGTGIGSGTGSENLQNLTDSLAAGALESYLKGSPYVFLKINDPVSKYIPVPAISNYTGMRYVWNASKNRAVLASGSRYYEFTLFSNQVKVGRTEADTLTLKFAPKIRSCMYIPEDFASEEFGCEALYIEGSDYAVLYTKEIQAQAEELFSGLLLGG